MAKTKVIKCTCTNKYQDSKYGKQMRVMNATLKGKTATNIFYRCTVCLTEHAK